MRNANHMRYSLVAWVSCWPSNDTRNLLAKKAAKWQMVNTTLCKSWQRPSICPPQPPHPPEERLQNSRAVHSNVENTTIILSEDKHQSRIMALAATALKRFQKLQNNTKHRKYENDKSLGPTGHVANIYVHSGFQMSKLQGCTYILFISFPFFIFIHIIYKSNYDHPSIHRSTGRPVGYGSNIQLCCNHPTSSDVFPPWQGSTEKVGSTGHVLGNIVSR